MKSHESKSARAEKRVEKQPKKPYARPELTVYGTVGKITEGAAGPAPDGLGGS